MLMCKRGILPLRIRRNIAHKLVHLCIPSIESIQLEILCIQQQQKQMMREQRVTYNVKRLVLDSQHCSTTTTTTLDTVYTAEAIPAEILDVGHLQRRVVSEPKLLQGDDAHWEIGPKESRMSEEQKRAFLKTRYGRMKIAHRQQRLREKTDVTNAQCV